MKTIRVMSREEIAREAFRRPVAVVSVRSPRGPVPHIPRNPRVVAVLRLEFDDVEDPRTGIAMSDEQARRVLDFVAPHVAAGVEIVCQCEAGVSRSAGMAAALSLIHYGHDGDFQRTHRPNAWVRRALLRGARRGPARAQEGRPASASGPSGPPEPEDDESKAIFLPIALPDLVLVRDGLKFRWTPASSRTYPPGTLGGDARTLAAHVFVPLRRKDGKKWDARAVGTWARQALRAVEATREAFVVTRAGAWHRASSEPTHVGVEPALEVYVQTGGTATRDAWTRTLRTFSDALGRKFRQDRFDVVLTEDGLMYKRVV